MMVLPTPSGDLFLRNLLSYLLQGPTETMNAWILPWCVFSWPWLLQDVLDRPCKKVNKMEIPSKSQLGIQKWPMFFAPNVLVFTDGFPIFIETCDNFRSVSSTAKSQEFHG